MQANTNIVPVLKRLVPMMKGVDKHQEVLKEIYHTLSQMYEQMGDLDTALYFYKEFAEFERTPENEVPGEPMEKSILVSADTTDSNEFAHYNTLETEKILTAIIDVQEHERKKIAQEIYDDMGQVISSIKLQLPSLVKPEALAEKSESLNDLIELLNKVFKEVQPLTDGLYPLTLETLGLHSVLEEMCRKASGQGLRMNFYADTADCEFPTWLQLTIYRIALELIRNIKIHSKASEASLQLICHDKYMILLAEDNGVGFDPEILNDHHTGRGLTNTKVRTQMIHGNFSIESRPGGGTVVSIEIPLTFS